MGEGRGDRYGWDELQIGVFLWLSLLILFPTSAAPEVTWIERYHVYELAFESREIPKSPFDEYHLRVEVTDPSGRRFTIDGFFDGDGKGGRHGSVWKARICPDKEGIWRWRTVPGDGGSVEFAGIKGQFICVAGRDRGGLVAKGRHFGFQNGGYVYLQGNFLDFAGGRASSHVLLSELLSREDRWEIFQRQRDFHRVNKINLYFANRGDYKGLAVTPWESGDLKRMDLAFWKEFEEWILRFRKSGIFVEAWFFADDSGFGSLQREDKNRLFRYGMARTSAFSNMLYVIALEWEEGWTKSDVREAGRFLQAHNPWRRLLSVHSLPVSARKWLFIFSHYEDWPFSGDGWATFIASQAGNVSSSGAVNALAIRLRRKETIPHLSEEFGILTSDTDPALREKLWANFCGGAAGGGTGSDIRSFMQFLEKSRISFQRMISANDWVEGGGVERFCLVEKGHQYLVYSRGGAFRLRVVGSGLKGYWYNPRDFNAALGTPFDVTEGRPHFVPPTDISLDWVLWISDGTNLGDGVMRPSGPLQFTKEKIHRNR